MTKPVFALVDCNNFFVSCERVFRPDLWDKPVAVLSNNDGCIVARSNEVKKLGIPMGAPYFKVKHILDANKVVLFSGNFPLYGDFSRRVADVIASKAPDLEIYSVDESFLEISKLGIADYDRWAKELCSLVWRWTGIPVSVGVGPTKTLAKLAAEYAKHNPKSGGYLSLQGRSLQVGAQRVLKETPVGNIWGVGCRLGSKLDGYGIKTAYDLTQLPDRWIRQHTSIRGLKTVQELRGISCMPISRDERSQKTIAATRSFGHTIRAVHELESAVASFVARASYKLRRFDQIAQGVSVFLRSGKHPSKPHAPVIYHHLPSPTSDTAQITQTALKALRQIYDADFSYKRAGIVLSGLVPASTRQISLLDNRGEDFMEKRRAVNETMDLINRRYGSGTLIYAVQGFGKKRWHSKRELRSQPYTTNWRLLPVARA